MLTRRLQILLDEDRYRRVAAKARERKVSVGALVREALDLAYPGTSPRRAAAARQLLSAERMAVPDLDVLRVELDELRARRA